MLDKDFFNQYQIQILWFANSTFGRWFFGLDEVPKDKRIIQLLPNSVTWVEKITTEQIFYKTSCRSNPRFALKINDLFRWLPFYAEKSFKKNGVWYLKPVFGLTTTTVYSTPSTSVSGNVFRSGVDQTLASIRAGAGTGNSFDAGANGIRNRLFCSTTTNQFSELRRGIFLFDTSSIPDGDTISAAQIELYCGEKDTASGAFEIDIVSSAPGSNTTLADTDYANLGTTVYSSLVTGSIATSAYNVFTLSAGGIATISKTGISKFGSRINWDTDNSFTGSWSSGGQNGVLFDDGATSGTTRDPKLVITHASAATPWKLTLLGIG